MTSPAPTPAPKSLLGETDLWLFGQGDHRRLWDVLGSHPRTLVGADGKQQHGFVFALWAPNAQRVAVVGDFNDWDASRHVLQAVDAGVRAVFVPGVQPGALYKYEVTGADGITRSKSDPFGRYHEQYPGYASITQSPSGYAWGDGGWMADLAHRNLRDEPVSIYEVHLGSWMRSDPAGDTGGSVGVDIGGDHQPLSYREVAPRLAAHVSELGFTHVELLPIMEHPFGGSWGYQVTGFFAPTSRYGDPDGLRFLIDTLHQAGIGVILDWVPAHFPGDEHGLGRFDGTALYEHEDPRQGTHPDWDTLIFNYGRSEVRGFLLASALYWLDEFHLDGLRVDAVASMLYLDYSRGEGEWIPNKFGGRENLDAIEFLKALTGVIRDDFPGRAIIAEESTSWPGVTAPLEEGGLGFTLKWNLGWMHDTLAYFKEDPLHRGWHQDKLTFAQLYEHSERFVMSLSHDECVHGKGSLLSKMPGDEWQSLANLRTLLAYQFTRPSKKLLFMGTELAPRREWDHDLSLDWDLANDPLRSALHRYLSALAHLYREVPCLWRGDGNPGAFEWIDCNDKENSVLSFLRFDPGAPARNGVPDHVVVVLNMTPMPREDYRIGVPVASGRYDLLLDSDAREFGGSEVDIPRTADVEAVGCHGRPGSMRLRLPPLAALVFAPRG